MTSLLMICRELDDIKNPVARHLFILAKANHLIHLRISEYKALITAADLSSYFGVSVLLDSCLAGNLAFVDRTRHLIQTIAVSKMVGDNCCKVSCITAVLHNKTASESVAPDFVVESTQPGVANAIFQFPG